jgi:hypothetical protein
MINSKYVTELKNTIKEFMDYRIKVKSYVCIDEMDYQLDPSKIIEVEVPVTENKWKSEMEILVEEIECNLEDEEFFAESDGEGIDNDSYNYYVDNYGMIHNGNSSQCKMAHHLMARGADMGTILCHLSTLGALRNAIIEELETNHPEKVREIQMLKELKDLDSDREKHHIEDEWTKEKSEGQPDQERLLRMVIDEYPLDLLDELARKVNQ